MTDSFEQPPSLTAFTEAVRSNDDRLVHGLAITMLESHFDTSLRNRPELWTPSGPHRMSLEQACTLQGEESVKYPALAGSTVEIGDFVPGKRRYGVDVFSTLEGAEYRHTAEWGKGDDQITLVEWGPGCKARPKCNVMSAKLVEMTVMHAHPDLTEIVAPTGFRAIMRWIWYRGTRTLYFAHSRIPGMTQPYPED